MDAEHRLDLAAVLELLPDPMILVNDTGVLLWGNRTAEETFGWSRADAIGRNGFELLHPDDLATALVSLESVKDKPLGTPVEVRVRTASGAYRLYEVRGRSLLDDPAVGAIVLSFRDLTDRRRWEVAAGDAAAVQMIVQHSSAISMLTDRDGKIRSASAALLRGLGRSLESAHGQSLVDLVHELDRGVVIGALDAARAGGRHQFEARMIGGDGRAVAYQITVVGLEDDPIVAGYIVTAQDISALAEARERLRYLATHDPLTGLANRSLLYDTLAERLAARPVALVYLDMNGFKDLNDRHGHVVGDAALVEVARRLVSVAGRDDLVARLGGDEFAVVTTPADARARAEAVSALMWAPFALGSDPDLILGAGVGTAVSPRGDVPDHLVAAADAAMYRAKLERRAPDS